MKLALRLRFVTSQPEVNGQWAGVNTLYWILNKNCTFQVPLTQTWALAPTSKAEWELSFCESIILRWSFPSSSTMVLISQFQDIWYWGRLVLLPLFIGRSGQDWKVRLEATTKVVDQRDSTLLIEYQNHATTIDDQVRRTCGGMLFFVPFGFSWHGVRPMRSSLRTHGTKWDREKKRRYFSSWLCEVFKNSFCEFELITLRILYLSTCFRNCERYNP